jgi:hypothetical protein
MWISEAGTIHRWFSGVYLMRSSGHILLSLLPISDWLKRPLISWLLFCAVRFLWFFAYVLMTSVTYGMRKSLCKVTFDMYQGAFVSFLNALDWNCSITHTHWMFSLTLRGPSLLWTEWRARCCYTHTCTQCSRWPWRGASLHWTEWRARLSLPGGKRIGSSWWPWREVNVPVVNRLEQ